MKQETVYDIIGIGIGPFNLGMAALTDSIPELKCLFIDENEKFDWHPGLMLERARLQVPFYADLVTMVDPCSRFSYLAFLKNKQSLFRFAIHEHNFVTRKEFNAYCQWVASQLECLRFRLRCEAIHYDATKQLYSIYARERGSQSLSVFTTRNIVLGVGCISNFPDCAAGLDDPFIVHSYDYLNVKEQLLTKKALTVVGSGQSAAEIFHDLLQHSKQFKNGLKWFTRSDRFFPMEYSKLSLEMTSPDYIDHFYRLSPEIKKRVLPKQNTLYKGINYSLVNEIYDELYIQNLSNCVKHIGLYSNSALTSITKLENGGIELAFHHSETEQAFSQETEAVVLATGYKYRIPSFLDPIREFIQWSDKDYNVNHNYSIDNRNSIFVQNAELHTHGFNAPDIGMGPYRNAIIINSIMGHEFYSLEKGVAFQTFGLPHGSR